MRGPLLASVTLTVGGVALAACSLTTSLDGLSGSPAGDLPSSDGGGDTSTGDASLDDGSAPADAADGALASAYRAMVIADGPVAYYRLSDTGKSAKDEMGAHDGTYIGTLSHGPGAIAGDSDGALVANGQGWIDIAQVFPFTGNASYSIEAWVAPSPSATLTGILARNLAAPGSTPSDGYSLYIESPSLAPILGRWRSSAEQSTAGPGLAADKFSHVVGTYDGSTLRVYTNGILTGSAAATQPIIAPAADLSIGATRNGTYGYFVGALDEIALYDRVLPDDRIAAHHALGRGP